MCFILFFFFKQKTAYEMRISDWSSDVCSSDLQDLDEWDEDGAGEPAPQGQRLDAAPGVACADTPDDDRESGFVEGLLPGRKSLAGRPRLTELGFAISCSLRGVLIR